MNCVKLKIVPQKQYWNGIGIDTETEIWRTLQQWKMIIYN